MQSLIGNSGKFRTLPIRAWRKFTRIPSINRIEIIVEESIKALVFRFNVNGRSTKSKKFQNCHSLEDYFDFSKEEFGPHQIKSEILNFLRFAKLEAPTVVCEIGTADGGTNFLLSQALPTVQLMLGVDLYVKKRSKLQFFFREEQEVKLINGSSYSDSTLNQVKSLLAGRKIDLLFIDGDHRYEGVKQDFLSYKNLVRDGGIIVFHDIVPDYLTRYGTPTGRWVGGVPQFWNRIKFLYPNYEFVENPDQDGLGIGAIRYSANVPLPEDL